MVLGSGCAANGNGPYLRSRIVFSESIDERKYTAQSYHAGAATEEVLRRNPTPAAATEEVRSGSHRTMAEWTRAWLLQQLGMAADFVPQTKAEEDGFVERCIDLLRAPTQSGYKEVYRSPTAGMWQAKPYAGPGKQPNLGTFPTAREAAAAIFWFKQRAASGTLSPAKPPKERRRRGTGRKPRDRRKGICT